MKRVRWFEAAWPCSMRTLATKLRQFTYDPESTDGFRIDRVRDTLVEGRHFEKISIEEVVRDPFGNETTFNRIAYREIDFVFSAAYPHVELRDCPRSLQTFLTRTSEATDFTTPFAAIDINILAWAEGIRDAFPKRFFITLAQLSGLLIEDDVSAKMTISSPRDVRAALGRLTRQRPHSLDRIQVTTTVNDTPIALLLSADGTLRTPDVLPSDVLGAIRRALPAPLTHQV